MDNGRTVRYHCRRIAEVTETVCRETRRLASTLRLVTDEENENV